MKIVKARLNYMTVLMASGEHILYHNSDPIAYKDKEGQWYRVKHVTNHTRLVLNQYLYNAKVNERQVEYVGWDAMIEMIGRL